MTVILPGQIAVYGDPTGSLRIHRGRGGVAASKVLVFNGTNTVINCGSNLTVDNLPAGAMTVEMCVNITAVGNGRIFLGKGHPTLATGWFMEQEWGNPTRLHAQINTDGVKPDTDTNNAILSVGQHHVAMCYNNAGDRKIHLFVDGVLRDRSPIQGTGNIGDDSAHDLKVGYTLAAAAYLYGFVAWVRLSNSIRYIGNFAAPAFCTSPAPDASTILLYALNEGVGVVATDTSGNGNHGAIANGAWLPCS